MADNKGQGDTESPASMEVEPPKPLNGDAASENSDKTNDTDATLKDGDDGQSRETAPTTPTPSAESSEPAAAAADGGGGGGEAEGGGEASASCSSVNVSPDGNSNTESTEPSLPAVDATANTTPVTVAGTSSPAPGTETAAVAASTPSAVPLNLLDTCGVCKQSLQSRECEPKLLPCLHSFCLKCIPQPERQISVGVAGPHGQDTHIVNVMRCTVCYQDYKQIDMVDNYFVKDTTEASSISTEKSTQVCTSCEDNASAIGFCVECGEWLCKTCIEAHQRVKFTKDHTIRKKEDVSQAESVSTSGQRTVFCPIHKQEMLKLFCETCDKLTCRDCQLLEHKEHRYQFLEEAFENQKGIIETFMAKLHEKRNFVQFSASQVQNRLKEASETHKKVEHEIKIAVFTLINEINKKGKALLQQLESVTKERTVKLLTSNGTSAHWRSRSCIGLRFTHMGHQQRKQHRIALQQEIEAEICHISVTQTTTKDLIDFWIDEREKNYNYHEMFVNHAERSHTSCVSCLKLVLIRCLMPMVRSASFCDPTFWAKNVVNLGNLVIEKVPPPAPHPQNMMMGQQILTRATRQQENTPGRSTWHSCDCSTCSRLLLHRNNSQQQQHQQQHQQMQQQMRIASQMSQHPRQGGPPQMIQQQPPRLISMQSLQREGVKWRAPHVPPSPSPAHGQLAEPHACGPAPAKRPAVSHDATAAPETVLPTPPAPTSASMASAHGHRGPTSPVVGPIELIPSVTNPENLPCLPDIPPIQLEDAGSTMLDNILSRYISANSQPPTLASNNLNSSPGPSTHSPGVIWLIELSHSCTAIQLLQHRKSWQVSGALKQSKHAVVFFPLVLVIATFSIENDVLCGAVNTAPEQVKVKQEPGAEEECGFSGANVKSERGKDGRRSACMMSSPEASLTPPLPVLGSVSTGSVQDILRTLGENIKMEPQSENQPPSCSSTQNPSSKSSASFTNGTQTTLFSYRSQRGSTSGSQTNANSQSNTEGKEDDPNEDWCAVCQNGGELLCCDRCPKVFHITCHIPTLRSSPSGDWMCTFCRSLSNPEIEYNCDDDPPSKKDQSEQGLSPEDQRRCERLLLYLFCHELSVEFQEPVPPSVPNYYKIIKHPMDPEPGEEKAAEEAPTALPEPQRVCLRRSIGVQQLRQVQRVPLRHIKQTNMMSRIIQVYDEEKQSNVQVGCELEEKERFWSELDEVMESIPTGERVVIGADFNGHVGEGKHRQKLRQALGGQVVLPDDWETTAEVIRETGRKVLGVSSGRRKEDKETWWWNEEVQDSIQRKRLAKKKWDMDRTEENRQEYKELQRRVKREVSKAKQKAYDELYTRLDTREGEKDLYRLARQRDRDGKDVQQVRVIKDGDGRVLTSEENLEKAYDRVPREELWYCMRKSGVAEKYVRVVQDMYERSRTVVRCAVGQTEEFKVEVGLHQGSTLSPFLFAIVMDQLSEEVRQESPWTMMFADDIVICSESREQVEENLERWRFALERRE
ncbi:hypothetical protein QTP70_031008 [Hemibagrus guttatus]|uniref:E3 ubiquitin-protein ligase TRIM33 n=1 Tax=Hemibagrus guttatus TaxID=175788 RepID=A0AAE0R275_9TELE|nr:hypothetical protein QTP70_031008 [Hemibagrus guttatus]